MILNNGHISSLHESYNEAVASLLSPLHQAASVDDLRAAAARRTNTLQDMHAYLHRLGLDVNNPSDQRIPKLIFHITGTKGKGSTIAFCECILRHGYNLNTGMFTSPHLVCIRERIRVNGLPISEEVFAEVYWTVRKKLESFDRSTIDESRNDLPTLPKVPGYFRMLALMAIMVFINCELPRIDVMLLEVGMGGRYDSTNLYEPCIQGRSLIRGVTLIDYDHMRVLGSTLENIAWEKGGIFCSNKLSGSIGRCDGGYDLFLHKYMDSARENMQTSSQFKVFASGNNTRQVLDVLRYIAKCEQCQLQVVNDSYLDAHSEIGLKGNHQRSNAALALAMCQYAIGEHMSSSPTPSAEQMQYALARTFWPGRCHTVSLVTPSKLTEKEASIRIRCDGAHTPISIDACIDWFRSVASGKETICRVLIFNCSHERNPLPLLYSLHQSKIFDLAYFCRADFERPSMLTKRLDEQWYTQNLISNSSGKSDTLTLKDVCTDLKRHICDISASTWQETLSNVWGLFNQHESDPDNKNIWKKCEFGMNVKSALQDIRKKVALKETNQEKTNSDHYVEICVTGSLYIIGSVLKASGWREQSIDCKMAISAIRDL